MTKTGNERQMDERAEEETTHVDRKAQGHKKATDRERERRRLGEVKRQRKTKNDKGRKRQFKYQTRRKSGRLAHSETDR